MPANDVVAPGRLPGDPLRLRERREDVADLRLQRGRGDRRRQEAQARAPSGRSFSRASLTAASKRAPRPDLPALGQRLRAVGVVDVEDGGLREDVRAAEARGMELVALDLDRPALVALGEDAARVAAVDVRRRVEERLAGDDLLGRLDVRDRCARSAGACSRSGPPSAIEAPISVSSSRRSTPESIGTRNSRWRCSRKSSVSSSSSRLRQYSRPRRPSSRAFNSFAALRSDIRSLILHRWHVVQSVSSNVGRILYSALSLLPISSWFPAGT